VIGCSPDTVEAQAAFKAKNSLPFTLLADEDHAIAEQYGVWVLKVRPATGEEYMGVLRATFIIGPDGVIKRVFAEVDPAVHAKELLEALAA
jgi:thioredoxin-dependent peroxiredoxin